MLSVLSCKLSTDIATVLMSVGTKTSVFYLFIFKIIYLFGCARS